ncbi:MAG: 4Fe-4S dicluster domain-containing protein [Anaerohalosphaera sp.]|nr:4Fe-4S dicluster domain-containing protein [Anaerohalosphaera sp.]
MSKAIITDVQKCLACRSCELACALAHCQSQILEESLRESPQPQPRVTVEACGKFAVPIQCRHCQDAPCMAVCPTAAIQRHSESDPVLISRDKCIGCGYCIEACPFGAMEVTNDGKAVVKCDLCIERTQVGQPPACVTACPTGAIKFKDVSNISADRRKITAAMISESLDNE